MSLRKLFFKQQSSPALLALPYVNNNKTYILKHLDHSFLLPNIIPLKRLTTVCLFIHPLKNIFVASSLGQFK